MLRPPSIGQRCAGLITGLALIVTTVASGCSSKPAAVQTGFLSDYSRLVAESDSKMRYVSPKLAEYDTYTVDPVTILAEGSALSTEDRAEAAAYFREAFVRVIEKENLSIVNSPGPGVARVRLALTDVAKSTWWKKVHPVSRATGAGTGGAAMEGEVTDSATGEQLGAVVQAGSGNQFNFAAFSTIADVKSAIDKWAEQAGSRLRELRESAQ